MEGHSMAFVGLSGRIREATRTRVVEERCKRRRMVVVSEAPNRSEFRKEVEDGKSRLCFVGMSNCGKSFRSSQLAKTMDFNKVCVDDEIESVILPELEALGYKGIEGMASWMGFPYDERFKRNEGRYLEIEEEITSSVEPTGGKNFVLDTTGSVVYMPPPVLQSLRDKFLVVHFLASDEMVSGMIENYFATPKPVSWGTSYNQKEGEDGTAALRRCYPDLLKTRREKYSKLAHVNIPAETTLSPNVNYKDFLDAIEERL